MSAGLQTGAHECENARRLGRGATRGAARAGAHAGTIRAQRPKTREDSGENVEFAIRLPGDENGAPVWLPIDAKFPVEDYQRLIAAQESGRSGRDRRGDEESGNAIAQKREGDLREIHQPAQHDRFRAHVSADRRVSTRKRSGGSGWSNRCSAIAGWSSPDQRRWRPCSTACKWDSARSRSRKAPAKSGVCSATVKTEFGKFGGRSRRSEREAAGSLQQDRRSGSAFASIEQEAARCRGVAEPSAAFIAGVVA